MSIVYLSLGANLGDKKENILRAITHLKNSPKIIFKKTSSFYETEPLGIKEQPMFLNLIMEIETNINPIDLLSIVKEIENKIGRKNRGKWCEREIDIDVIFFDSIIISDNNLRIPHGELSKRRFVLEPLNEIAPEFVCPLTKRKVSTILKECTDTSFVKRLD